MCNSVIIHLTSPWSKSGQVMITFVLMNEHLWTFCINEFKFEEVKDHIRMKEIQLLSIKKKTFSKTIKKLLKLTFLSIYSPF